FEHSLSLCLCSTRLLFCTFRVFIFQDPAPTAIYPFSLHDALPICILVSDCAFVHIADDIPREWIMERLHIEDCAVVQCCEALEEDRKSTRLNSSHVSISYAVFCLKKKIQYPIRDLQSQ